MSAVQIDFLVGAALGLLYMLYVFVRVVRARSIGWLAKVLIIFPIVVFPIGGALFVHVLICVSTSDPRDDRFLGCLGLAGALAALLAYGSTFARFAVHDVYAFSYILLGVAAFLVLAPFVIKAAGVLRDLPSMFPKWAILLAGLAVVSAVAHIGLWYAFADGGVPRERSGSYYLSSEGGSRAVPRREITRDEYYAQSGHFVRATSSLLFAFLLVPALFFLMRRPGEPAADRIPG